MCAPAVYNARRLQERPTMARGRPRVQRLLQASVQVNHQRSEHVPAIANPASSSGN